MLRSISHVHRRSVAGWLIDSLRRGMLQLTLAMLLITAQFGALNHGIEHLNNVLGGHSVQFEPVKNFNQCSECDFHAAFVQVIGAVGSVVISLPHISVPTETAVSYRFQLFPFKAPVPASRGPPQLL